MSEAPTTATPAVAVAEHATTTPVISEPVPAAETTAPVTEESKPAVEEPVKPVEETAAAPAEEKKVEETAATTATAEKTIEPISDGQLAYKGPGLVKSLIPSKKIFWLSDAPVTPQNLHLYMRGEKPEVSNPVVAWASQTGKGLLFFNKKDETDKTKPHSVLPLYEATELKKVSPHEISFEINSHKHTLKAASDVERDGWYMSLERAVEVGKAEKETLRESEGYKAEMEKLNKPNTVGAGAVGSAAKKSTDAEEPKRAPSDDDTHKKQKSRSTSRGFLSKIQGKKEESEAKKEEKKIEKEEAKEEKDEAKAEKEAEKSGEAAPVVGGTALDAPSTAERVLAAPVEEFAAEPSVVPTTEPVVVKSEEPKSAKRGSIFGRFGNSFSGIRSPNKEKDLKEAELKAPEVPPKDAMAVSETAPQIPEPATESETPVVAPATEVTEPKTEGKSAEAAKEQLDTVSPKENKGGFLGGFLNKRSRSVSPSANMKEAPKKEETAVVAPAETTTTSEAPVIAAVPEADKAAEPVATEPTAATPEPTKAEKRSSVFGGLGRRASKAFKGFQSPAKKENEVPATSAATEATKEESTETPVVAPATEETKPAVNGETKTGETIGDVVPDAVHTGQPQSTPIVTASA